GIGEISLIPAQREAGRRKAEIIRRGERDRQDHDQRQHEKGEHGAGHGENRAALQRGAVASQCHRVSPRSTRWNVPWISSAAASSSAESAAAKGQSRNWRTCCSMRSPIVITRPPPRIAGVMKKPRAITKTRTLPAKAPGS